MHPGVTQRHVTQLHAPRAPLPVKSRQRNRRVEDVRCSLLSAEHQDEGPGAGTSCRAQRQASAHAHGKNGRTCKERRVTPSASAGKGRAHMKDAARDAVSLHLIIRQLPVAAGDHELRGRVARRQQHPQATLRRGGRPGGHRRVDGGGEAGGGGRRGDCELHRAAAGRVFAGGVRCVHAVQRRKPCTLAVASHKHSPGVCSTENACACVAAVERRSIVAVISGQGTPVLRTSFFPGSNGGTMTREGKLQQR